MVTVRQTVQDLVDGSITLQEAVTALRGRTEWDSDPAVAPAQLFGVEDVPPAGDNHPEQIELIGFALSPQQRRALWQAVAGGSG